MNVDRLRELAFLSLARRKQIQWGYDLLFKVGGRLFAVTPLEPAPVCLSFKSVSGKFAALTSGPTSLPAPYLARAQWVALQTRDALPRGTRALGARSI